MISVLISVAFMAAEPADFLGRGKSSCSNGSCSASVSVSKEVTTTKKVETTTCSQSKKSGLRSHRFLGFRKTCR